MSKTRIAVVGVLFLLMSLCSCGEKPVEAPDISMPPSSSALEEVPVSAPSDPMDDVYPVTVQEDAAEILKRAYEGMIPELTFATVYKGNIIKNLIMDCQSYTKYRPNETTGGIFCVRRSKSAA